jgi:hypothetical protein
LEAILAKEVDNRKKQIAKSHSTSIQDTQERLNKQATMQHKKCTDMSAHNMFQYTANVQNLLSNKVQELTSATAKWKENFESAIKLIQAVQGKLFEKRCQDMQKQETQKAERIYTKQERKLEQKARETEEKLDEMQENMIQQAQSLLDQLPMNMGDGRSETGARNGTARVLRPSVTRHGGHTWHSYGRNASKISRIQDRHVSPEQPKQSIKYFPTPAQHAERT